MDLKNKALAAVLRSAEIQFEATGHPQHVWFAWKLVRQKGLIIPEWVLRFVDQLASSSPTRMSRAADTAARYAAALQQMDAAVEAHRRRVTIRNVGKRLGVSVHISRRDRPNLTTIARLAANAHRVSVNRLLAQYRSRAKAAKR